MGKNFFILQKNDGFTLAEVLITLGIIGVIAALTLPSIVNSSQKREIKAKLEKNYSIAQQALQKLYYDEGIVKGGLYEGRTFEPKYVKYFNVLKDCGLSYCVLRSNHENDDGSVSEWYIENYKTYSRKRNVETSMFDDGQFYTTDGSFYMIENPGRTTGEKFVYISIDVNGAAKKPNAWGHDLFTFQVMDNGKLLPMGAPDTVYNNKQNYCSASSNSAINGLGCAYYALTNEDYFKNLP